MNLPRPYTYMVIAGVVFVVAGVYLYSDLLRTQNPVTAEPPVQEVIDEDGEEPMVEKTVASAPEPELLTFNFFNKSRYGTTAISLNKASALQYDPYWLVNLIETETGAILVKDLFREIQTQIPDFEASALKPFSFPHNTTLFFSGAHLASEGNEHPLVAYEVATGQFSVLKYISEFHSMWNVHALSPDGTQIAEVGVYGEYSFEETQRLRILSLTTDTATLEVELSGHESFISACEMGCNGSLRWVDNDTIEYDVYDARGSLENPPTGVEPRPRIETRRVSF